MIGRVIPPLCLLLALAMLIIGFTVMAMEPPSDSLELHQARVVGNDALQEVLEVKLEKQQRNRRMLLGSLFIGASLMVVLAFASMGPSR